MHAPCRRRGQRFERLEDGLVISNLFGRTQRDGLGVVEALLVQVPRYHGGKHIIEPVPSHEATVSCLKLVSGKILLAEKSDEVFVAFPSRELPCDGAPEPLIVVMLDPVDLAVEALAVVALGEGLALLDPAQPDRLGGPFLDPVGHVSGLEWCIAVLDGVEEFVREVFLFAVGLRGSNQYVRVGLVLG